MPELLLLFESASGYALLQQLEFEEVGEDEESVQQAILDPKLFSKMVKLKAFLAFETAEEVCFFATDWRHLLPCRRQSLVIFIHMVHEYFVFLVFPQQSFACFARKAF